MRILAVDFGEKRMGFAVSDELGITAQGLETVVLTENDSPVDVIIDVFIKNKAEKIVIGLPLNMNGSESEKSEKVRKIGSLINEKICVTVIFWDERMTSKQAQRVMNEMGKKILGNKTVIDRISATLILQEFLKTQ